MRRVEDMMEKHGSVGSNLASGAVGAVVVLAVAGVVDVLWSVSHADEVHASVMDLLGLVVQTAGLYVPLGLPLCLVFGLVMGVLPVAVGPSGALGAVRRLVGVRGDAASVLSGWIWSVGLGLLVSWGVMVKMTHLFVTTFHHPTLIAVSLAVFNLVWMVVALGGVVLVARALRKVLRGALGSPVLPVGLGVLGVLGVLVAVPVLFEETWDALDLRAPLMGFGLVVGSWACVGLVAARLRGMRAVMGGVVGLLVSFGLLGSALAFFGDVPEDAAMVYAVRERGLLARVPLGMMQSRFDSDGDHYASRLGGGDCDDSRADIYPGADEIIGNGVDEDCDGVDLVLDPVVAEVKAGEGSSVVKGDKRKPVDALAKLRKKYNVVWVMIDTVRGDAMGYMGYERPTTPNLDKLAARSTVFERATSISSKTPTVMGPVLAGQYPSEMERSFQHFVRFGESNLFLAEILRDEGYLTAAAGCHWYFQRKYGYSQGFSRWKPYMVQGDEMERISTSKQVTDTAIGFLKAMSEGGLPADGVDPAKAGESGKDAPFFLFVHYLDPHKHYIDHKGFEPFGKGPRARYDGEIRFTDHHLGRLLAELEARDPGLKETLVIITSDHGEAFGEHDQRFHGRDLYDHQLHVPLIVSMPGGGARRIKERVSLIDLPLKVLDALGVKAPARYRGTSLLPQIGLGEPLVTRPLYAEMPPGPYNGEFRALMVGDWKLIHRLHGNYYRLFNVAEDPGELHDLMRKMPEKGKEMKKAYQLFRAQHVKAVKAVKKL